LTIGGVPRSYYDLSPERTVMSQHPLIKAIEASFHRTGLPDFRSGDSVRVHTLIKEGDKERVQVFEGVVIDRRRGGARASFTVRKISYGVGVERIFPLHTSRIEKVEIVQKGRVRRARLNYLRQLEGRAARIKSERSTGDERSAAAARAAVPAPPVAPPPPAPEPATKPEGAA
jgi:large subunit ribosomal protein L19